MDKQKLNKLKKGIRGHQKKVADKTGLSIAAVSRVLNGVYNNDEVINAAIQVRDEVKQERELLMSKI